MKYQNTKSLATLLLAATASSLSAIERPVPADQPKEKPAVQPAPAAAAEAPAQDAKPLPLPEVKQAVRPYLGVLGKSASDVFAAQLNLPKGQGLTLRYIADNSPAAKLGLKKHDILTQIDGKNVGNQEALRDIILGYKPKDKVELKYFSGGKEITRNVELGSAPSRRAAMPKNAQQPPQVEGGMALPKGALPEEMLKNLPPAQRKQLEQLLKGNLNKLDFRNLDNLDVDQLQKHFEGFKKLPKLELNFKDLMNQGNQQKTRMKMVDPDGSVTLETDGDKKNIELHDTEGKLLYKGPYNTDEDKLKIPKELRERAGKIKGLQLNMGKAKGKLPNMPKIPNLKGLKLPKELKQLLEQGGAGAQGFVIPPHLLEGLQIPQGNPGQPGQQLQQLQQFQFNLGNGAGNMLEMNMNTTMTDPATGNRYSLRKNKDGNEIEIHDKTGKLLYGAPYDTSADKEMVPEEYQPFLQKLEAFKMNNKNRLKLELKPRKK